MAELHAGRLRIEDGAVLEVGTTLSVFGESELLMRNGHLRAEKVTGEGSLSVNGGSLELQDDTDALAVRGTVTISGSMLKGTWAGDGLSIGGSQVTSGSTISLTNLTLTSSLSNAGTLKLGGQITVQSEGYDVINRMAHYSGGTSGYRYYRDDYTLVSGSGTTTVLSGTTWNINRNGEGIDTAYSTLQYNNGILTVFTEQDTSTYWVNGSVTYDGRSEFDSANMLVLNGGRLTVATSLGGNLTGGIRVDATGTLDINSGVELSSSSLSGLSVDRQVTLQGCGALNIDQSADLNAYSAGSSWYGTLKVTNFTIEENFNLNQLRNANSSLVMDGGLISAVVEGDGVTMGCTKVTSEGSLNLTNFTLSSTLSNEGLLSLAGIVTVQSEGVEVRYRDIKYSSGENGYREEKMDYILVSGSGVTTALSGTEWDVVSNGKSLDLNKETIQFDDGVLTVNVVQDKSTYWVNSEVTYDGRSEFDAANTLQINGGELTLAAQLGDNLTGGIRVVSSGTLAFAGDLQYSFVGSIALEQGTLHMAETLVISKGRELVVTNDSSLNTTLYLEDGRLGVDFAGSGTATSLNSTNLLLSGGTELQLLNAGNGDGRIYNLFADIYGLKDANGNALELSADNNAASLYFDANRPGTGFWKNATLQLSADGTLQLVRYTDITVPTGYARTVVMDESSDFTRYAGLTSDVAFRLAADVEFDASAAVMTNLAASRYFTSDSVDALSAISFRNSENRMFYVKENETLIMKALRAVTFEDLAVRADEAISGGSIHVSDNSGITLEDNGAVIFRGTSLTANGAAAQGGALYAGATSPVVLNGNGSVELLENSAVGSFSYGGAMYATSTVLLSNNNGVIFRDNFSVSEGGAIDAGAELTLSDNGSVEFSGNTSGQGGAINAATNVVLEANGVVSFSGNEATSGSGAAIYATGDVSLTNNGSLEISGNTASASGGAIYGSAVTVNGNLGAVAFCENTTTSGSGAAIYATGAVSLTDNGSLEFSGNTASASGGAVYGSAVTVNGNLGAVAFCENTTTSGSGAAIYATGAVSLTDNGNLEFSGNSVKVSSSYASGGAIYGGYITLSGNGSVTFSGNVASSSSYYARGGAIYGSATLSGNGSVTFSENTVSGSYSYGGAIYGESDSTITLSWNGSVEFSGNLVSSSSTIKKGGAVFTYGSVTIAGNNEVMFAGNVEKSGSTYRLRGLYLAGDSSGDKLTLSAGKGQSICFYDSIYMGASGSVELNADYQDADGVTQKASGTILFSGATTEDDLKEAKEGVVGTDAEILNSRTSELNCAATLYGGSLQVQDKAVLNLNGGMTVAESGTATMQVQNGATLNLSAMTIAKDAQASIEVSGGSAMTASGQVSVAAGGTAALQVQKSELNLNGGLTVAAGSTATMQVQDGAAFNLSDMTIAENAQATLEVTGGSSMTASGQVNVAAGGLASLKVQDSKVNWEKSSLALSAGNRIELQDNAEFNLSDMTIAENAQASIKVSGGSVMTSSGQVHVAAGGLASLKVQESEVNLGSNALALTSGSLVELQNGASLSLSELTVAAGAELKAGGYIAPVAEAAGAVAFSLEGIESDTPIVNTGSVNHLEGNLRLAGGSTLNLQDSYLTVSGDLVLDVTAESEKVVVELTPGIAKDELSQVVLFEVTGAVTFGENGTASDSEVVYYQFAEDYFTGDWISQDTWLVYDRNTNLVYLEGVNIIASVPEPTSSMLGIVGLVAFTLRRRRR